MKTTLLKCPPFNMIEEDKALQCLMLTDPDKRDIKDILESNKNVSEVLVFLKDLKRGSLLEISFDHGAISDTSYFQWVYHPEYKSGVVIWLNDSFPDEPRYENLELCTSEHLGIKLRVLFDQNGFEPENISGDKVEAPLEGMEVKDLVSALATSVFAGKGDKSREAALAWVKNHVKQDF